MIRKTRHKMLLLGAMSAVVLGGGLGWHNSQVCAQGTCGDRWTGGPSDSPSVDFSCDSPTYYVVTPVTYKQTLQNPCEGTTGDERSCELTYEFVEVKPNNNGTPNDPDDDFNEYIFRKKDSCDSGVSGTEPMRPNLGCCVQ